MNSNAGAVDPSERIVSLDVLRGVAILGILLINVQSFSMPSVARMNPAEFGDFSGMNFFVWLLSHLFAEQKFITIFTLLFGTGILLFLASKGSERSGIRLHYRRMFWLLVIGLIHAYLLWDGDILVAYALCGLWAIMARDWSEEGLLAVGTVLIAVPFVARVDQAIHLDPGASLGIWEASQQSIQAEIEAYRGSWNEQFEERFYSSLSSHTTQFLTWTGWRTTGLMLIGMALYKLGVMTGDRSTAEYRKLAVGGCVGGLLITGSGLLFLLYYDWAGGAGYMWPLFNYWGSILMAVGYIGIAMLVVRYSPKMVGVGAMAAVGKTALSNYLFQTVVATSIFYGFGLGLFGDVSRVEQLGIVVAIWTMQVVLSVLWLSRFKYGPMEYLWRKLTYYSFR